MIKGRSALGIHTLPSSTASATGIAGKTCIFSFWPCKAFISLSVCRINSRNERDCSRDFKKSLLGESILILQIVGDLITDSILESKIVALRDKTIAGDPAFCRGLSSAKGG